MILINRHLSFLQAQANHPGPYVSITTDVNDGTRRN